MSASFALVLIQYSWTEKFTEKWEFPFTAPVCCPLECKHRQCLKIFLNKKYGIYKLPVVLVEVHLNIIFLLLTFLIYPFFLNIIIIAYWSTWLTILQIKFEKSKHSSLQDYKKELIYQRKAIQHTIIILFGLK